MAVAQRRARRTVCAEGVRQSAGCVPGRAGAPPADRGHHAGRGAAHRPAAWPGRGAAPTPGPALVRVAGRGADGALDRALRPAHRAAGMAGSDLAWLGPARYRSAASGDRAHAVCAAADRARRGLGPAAGAARGARGGHRHGHEPAPAPLAGGAAAGAAGAAVGAAPDHRAVGGAGGGGGADRCRRPGRDHLPGPAQQRARPGVAGRAAGGGIGAGHRHRLPAAGADGQPR